MLKKNKKTKKWWTVLGAFLGLSVISLATSCSVGVGSVSNIQQARSKFGYDFGLAINPLNNLNYVRYNSVRTLLPSLVDSFIKTGPSTQLKRLINLNSYDMYDIDTSGSNDSDFNDFYKKYTPSLEVPLSDSGLLTGNFRNFPDFNLVGGLGAPSNSQRRTIYGFPSPLNQLSYMAVTGVVNNNKNFWSNGDIISAQDIRDYLEYILDLNTGSQKLDSIMKFQIAGTQQFINAQLDYLRKFGKNYVNPWGRRKYIKSNNDIVKYIQDPNQKVWQSENPGDEKAVAEIKQAALNFSFYTGQIFLDYTNKQVNDNLSLPQNAGFSLKKDSQPFYMKDAKGKVFKVQLVKNQYCNPKQVFMMGQNNKKIIPLIEALSENGNEFSIYFNPTSPVSIDFLAFNIFTNLYPIDRKYVELNGGILDYGSSIKKFLTSGPFVIKPNDAVLGPQGYIILTKNNDYFDAADTFSNRIKIYFSNNQNIDAVLFDDGYISQTYIPANRINYYWSQAKYRKLLTKDLGYGTIAYNFNLDYETNAKSYVFDSNLRNALLYVVNRADILKTAGWDFSLPTTYFTDIGQNRTPDGKNLEFYLDGLKTRAKNMKTYPIENYNSYLELSKNYNFESLSRRDTLHDIATAKWYLEQFKKEHPNLSGVTLNFIDNSTDQQKKAGLYLQYVLNQVFGGYVSLNIKGLPENTYATFIQEGKYDIVYQDLDRLGGDNVQSYIQVFFSTDEIDSLNQKSIGFVTNVDGSWTYADYFSNLVMQQKYPNSTKAQVVAPVINQVMQAIQNNPMWNSAFNSATKTQSLEGLSEFKNKYLASLVTLLQNNNKDNNSLNTFFTQASITDIIDYLFTNNNNIKMGRLAKILNYYLISTLGVNQIATITKNSADRMYINMMKWTKMIDLSYQLPNQSSIDFNNKISSFFSGQFDKTLNDEGWYDVSQTFELIGSFEKIIRDAAPVIPLMEVDTRWEISRVGGTDSLYTLSLQYAYDYSRPPRPGLPTAKEGS